MVPRGCKDWSLQFQRPRRNALLGEDGPRKKSRRLVGQGQPLAIQAARQPTDLPPITEFYAKRPPILFHSYQSAAHKRRLARSVSMATHGERKDVIRRRWDSNRRLRARWQRMCPLLKRARRSAFAAVALLDDVNRVPSQQVVEYRPALPNAMQVADLS